MYTGSAERVKSLGLLRPPTVNLEEYQNHVPKGNFYAPHTPRPYPLNDYGDDQVKSPSVLKSSLFKQISIDSTLSDIGGGKGIQLKDFSTSTDWTEHSKNPDYKLAVVHGANPGFQCKFNSIKGSYLLYEFAKRVIENETVRFKDKKTLGEIFQDIQDYLHDEGKQQIMKMFNTGTQYIKFKAKKFDIEEKIKNEDFSKYKIGATMITSKSSVGYKSVDGDEYDESDDDLVLNEIVDDVMRMPSNGTVASLPLTTQAIGNRSRDDSFDTFNDSSFGDGINIEYQDQGIQY